MPKSPPISVLPDSVKYFDELPAIANVRLQTVEALYGCSGSTVKRLVKRGDIPKPRKLSGRISVWRVGELRASLKGTV
jgi:predicted DNA-binding transcriptional regulator AlpA